MDNFNKKIKLNSSQRKEIESYLGKFTTMNEYGFLQLVRKMKQLERKLEEMSYERK